MKTAAYFSDFMDDLEAERARCEQLKKETGARRLVAVMSGDFLQNGLPAAEPCSIRAKKALAAGADMVAEMSLYASLSSLGIYAFSAARILDRLETVETLILETEDAGFEELNRIAFILIANTGEFQKRVSDYKEKGLPFYEAQADAIGEEVENGGRIMRSRYNIFAVECIKSLKLMYSSVKCVCVPKRGRTRVRQQNKKSSNLSQLLRYQLCFLEPHLSDIYGGYEELTNLIKKKRDTYTSFIEFAKELAGEDKDIYDIQKYFMRLLCGITKSTISIWRMYDFSPYCKVCAEDEQLLEEMKENSKIVLLNAGVHGDKEILNQKLDRSKRELLEQEERCRRIYDLL